MFARSTRFAAGVPAGTLTMALVLFGCRPVVAQEPGLAPAPQAAAPAPDQEQAEHLLRGPLHEAFAEPVNFDPQPGIVVPKSPPDPIEEIPPEIKPAGEAIWIPGYWAWDDERGDFLWVSGGWRVPPPQRRWVPGYWLEVEDGYQWISGFWAPLESAEVSYLPQPPESVERGPSSPPPSDDHFWVNGCWEYHQGRYVWRSGYWAIGREGWVWVPARYAWTPYGCVYVPGYWDYQFVDRGMCFTPTYFFTPIYTRPGYYYRPSLVLDLARVQLHLFVRPRYCHYYYGDWYGAYEHRGIYAPFHFHGRYGYDPLWTYHRWHFRRLGIDYDHRVRGWHRYFERHEDRRPPRSWEAQRQLVERNRDSDHLRQVVLADDLQSALSKRAPSMERISDDARQRMRQNALAMRQLAEARRDGERADRPGGEGQPRSEAARRVLRLPETPDARDLRRRMPDRVETPPERQVDRRPLSRQGSPPSQRLDGGPLQPSERRPPERMEGRSAGPQPGVERPELPTRPTVPERLNQPQTPDRTPPQVVPRLPESRTQVPGPAAGQRRSDAGRRDPAGQVERPAAPSGGSNTLHVPRPNVESPRARRPEQAGHPRSGSTGESRRRAGPSLSGSAGGGSRPDADSRRGRGPSRPR